MRPYNKFQNWAQNHGAVTLVAAVSFLNGLAVLLGGNFRHFYGLRQFNFVLISDPTHISRYLSLILGLILIYLASKLLSRSQMAWFLSISLLSLLIVVHILFNHDIDESLIAGIALILLMIYSDQFQVRNDYELLWQGIVRSVFILLAALAYGALGFWLLFRRDFGHDFSFVSSLNYAWRELLLIGTDLVPHSRFARWFITSLNLTGLTAIILAFLSFFKPLKYRLSTLPREYEFMKNLLDKYGDDSEDFFKLWPRDKRYFISQSSALAYKVKNDVAIVLGDPAGKKTDFPALVEKFYDYAHRAGWLVAAVHCRQKASEIYESQDSKKLVVGSEAVVDISNFLTHTSKNKHWRNIKNRFEKAGFTTELVSPPLNSKLMSELKRLSDQWLKLPGREEMTFGLGYFDHNYIRSSQVLVLRDKAGQLVAFLNLVHSYDPSEYNVDLMRHLPGAVSNVNDYLVLALIERLGKNNRKYLNLGLCPLKGVDEVDDPTPGTRALQVIYGSNRFFSFQGLVRFKNKFEPEWRERYLVYQNGVPGLIRTALAINKAFRLDK